jgi:hypothetical protein
MAMAIRAAIHAVPVQLARDPALDVGHHAHELADLFHIATARGSPGTYRQTAATGAANEDLPWEGTGLAWSAVALAGMIAVLGPPLQWPAWTMDISPFTQTPSCPAARLRRGLMAVIHRRAGRPS